MMLRLLIIIILIILAVVGFYLEFFVEYQVTSRTKKKKTGLVILVITTIGFISTSLFQYFDSRNLDRKIDKLIKHSYNDSVNINELKNMNDFLSSQLVVIDNQNDSQSFLIETLNSKVSSGFYENKKSIAGLKIRNFRKIDNATKQKLLTTLSGYSDHKVRITYMMDSEESNQLALQFKEVFTDVGWIANFSFATYPPDFKNVRFHSKNDSSLLRLIGGILLDSELDFKLSYDNKLSDNELEIIVGYK